VPPRWWTWPTRGRLPALTRECEVVTLDRPMSPKFRVLLYRVEFLHSLGQNENRRFSGLCQLPPAVDMPSHELM
jgi:hypothetical protein